MNRAVRKAVRKKWWRPKCYFLFFTLLAVFAALVGIAYMGEVLLFSSYNDETVQDIVLSIFVMLPLFLMIYVWRWFLRQRTHMEEWIVSLPLNLQEEVLETLVKPIKSLQLGRHFLYCSTEWGFRIIPCDELVWAYLHNVQTPLIMPVGDFAVQSGSAVAWTRLVVYTRKGQCIISRTGTQPYEVLYELGIRCPAILLGYSKKLHKLAKKDFNAIVKTAAQSEVSDEDIYHRVRSVIVSYNCEEAAKEYFRLITDLCLKKPVIAHSLMRIAMRPIFYSGITDYSEMVSCIKDINKWDVDFLQWLDKQGEMLLLILKELSICSFLHDLEYWDEKNMVVLDYKEKDSLPGFFADIQDTNSYKWFASLTELKAYVYSLFHEGEMTEAELERIVLEEEYYDKYFKYIV